MLDLGTIQDMPGDSNGEFTIRDSNRTGQGSLATLKIRSPASVLR